MKIIQKNNRRQNTQKMRNKVKYEKLTTWDSFVWWGTIEICVFFRLYCELIRDQNKPDPMMGKQNMFKSRTIC